MANGTTLSKYTGEVKHKYKETPSRDTVYTGRSLGDYDISLVQEWKVYYNLVF